MEMKITGFFRHKIKYVVTFQKKVNCQLEYDTLEAANNIEKLSNELAEKYRLAEDMTEAFTREELRDLLMLKEKNLWKGIPNQKEPVEQQKKNEFTDARDEKVPSL